MSRWERLKKRVHYLLNKLIWLLVIGFITNTVYVTLFMIVERRSFSDSMWWGWVTGFTVGYGDISPVSNMGRAIAVCAMVTDFVLLACFSGQVTAMVIIAKDLYSEAEQALSKHRNRTTELIARATLESNYRIEKTLDCLPPKTELPVIPPYETDEEVLARLAEAVHEYE